MQSGEVVLSGCVCMSPGGRGHVRVLAGLSPYEQVFEFRPQNDRFFNVFFFNFVQRRQLEEDPFLCAVC